MRRLFSIPLARIAAFCAVTIAVERANAQTPTQPNAPAAICAIESSLGPSPGAPGGGVAATADLSGQLLLGRPNRRVPSSIARPGATSMHLGPLVQPSRAATRQPTAPTRVGPLALPTDHEEPGPPNGLTIDQAIEVLRLENLGLRAKRMEIPQAQADILSAGLRSNPFIYGDGQLLPYGQYSPTTNPGGPAQFDFNITFPIDWNLKRRSRLAVACRARNVIEALYQNAVRIEIGNLYNAYVDALAARETARFAHSAFHAIDQLLAAERQRRGTSIETRIEFDQIELDRESARLGMIEAETAVRASKRRLAMLLSLPPNAAERIELLGTLHDQLPPPPPVADVIAIGLGSRPDLAAYRLGIQRADADIGLARANRFSDLYLLYQPYTYQNNSPFGLPSSTSWAVGATVAVPLFDRNQGTIRRANVNAQQTRMETRALERAIVSEIEDAYAEYVASRDVVHRIATGLLPHARRVLEDNLRLYREGRTPLISYLSAQRGYGEIVRQYRDALVRHRRSMLDLNTAVGERLLP